MIWDFPDHREAYGSAARHLKQCLTLTITIASRRIQSLMLCDLMSIWTTLLKKCFVKKSRAFLLCERSGPFQFASDSSFMQHLAPPSTPSFWKHSSLAPQTPSSCASDHSGSVSFPELLFLRATMKSPWCSIFSKASS
ncbi:hypothetical protein CapIbe_020229 [Capra ibex]